MGTIARVTHALWCRTWKPLRHGLRWFGLSLIAKGDTTHAKLSLFTLLYPHTRSAVCPERVLRNAGLRRQSDVRRHVHFVRHTFLRRASVHTLNTLHVTAHVALHVLLPSAPSAHLSIVPSSLLVAQVVDRYVMQIVSAAAQWTILVRGLVIDVPPRASVLRKSRGCSIRLDRIHSGPTCLSGGAIADHEGKGISRCMPSQATPEPHDNNAWPPPPPPIPTHTLLSRSPPPNPGVMPNPQPQTAASLGQRPPGRG